jgi:hypothetical protein
VWRRSYSFSGRSVLILGSQLVVFSNFSYADLARLQKNAATAIEASPSIIQPTTISAMVQVERPLDDDTVSAEGVLLDS